jgi:hypothetical protein
MRGLNTALATTAVVAMGVVGPIAAPAHADQYVGVTVGVAGPPNPNLHAEYISGAPSADAAQSAANSECQNKFPDLNCIPAGATAQCLGIAGGSPYAGPPFYVGYGADKPSAVADAKAKAAAAGGVGDPSDAFCSWD